MAFRLYVAVLPLDYIGNDPEQTYFVDGLTADLVTDLSSFQSLHVVGPSRRSEWSGAILPAMSESGAEAAPRSARYLVRGALRRTSARIRVTAQLEDAQSRVILWSGRFDRVFDVYFVGSKGPSARTASFRRSSARSCPCSVQGRGCRCAFFCFISTRVPINGGSSVEPI